jgi:hypothetical protein
MPSFRLVEVPHGSSFDTIAPAMFKGWAVPRQPSFEFFNPIRGTHKGAYDEAVEEASKRMTSNYSEDLSQLYITVVDDDNNGAVVAGAELHIYKNNEANPYTRDSFPPSEQFIEWWPEGDTRKFVAKMFDAARGIAKARMRRPHICRYRLNLATESPDLPAYCKKGSALCIQSLSIAGEV